jgi:hypothetical protein
MMVLIYFCAVMQAMAPAGQSVARYYATAVENSFKAVVEQRNDLADQIADLRTAR